MELKYIKTETDDYKTIRQILKQEFKMSSNLTLKLKKNEKLLLNSKFTYLDKPLTPGDIISAVIDFDEDNSNIVPVKMNLDILYEDDYLLIVNKPAGIPVHPSIEHYEDSLSNGIKYYFDSIKLHRKIRPVNRLDRNTSGIVIFAKNAYVQERLVSQMNTKDFKKTYIAICEGPFEQSDGTINKPIARKKDSIIERCISEDGQVAITHFHILEEKNNISKVEIYLETGRTHQIRVHMAYIKHPIIGDDLYGKSSSLINRQALHAFKVYFIHPIDKRKIEITSELPIDMQFFN